MKMTTPDPRGIIRTITAVKESSGDTLVTLDCGHTNPRANHFHYKVGSKCHCFACGQEALLSPTESQNLPNQNAIKVFLQTETLSDGSEVFNVRIGNVVMHAVDLTAARDLADRIAEAINELTVDEAEACGEAWYA